MSNLSYSKGSSTPALLSETIGENLRRTVERFGDREALVASFQNYRATYRQFWNEVDLAARGLMARGVQTGDRVGIWAPNRYEWVIIQYATARIGAILVNINPAYKTAELEYALNLSGVSCLIMAKGFRATDYVSMLEQVRGKCPDLCQYLVIENDWFDLLEQGKNFPEEKLLECEARLRAEDPINIQFTSGTTGLPKGATLSHHNILNNAYFTGLTCRYTELDRVCIPVPFYHCFGMVLGTLACTAHGACMVVPAEGFDALETLRTVEVERCTSLYGVPTMFIGELEHPEFSKFDLTSLRTGIMAGSPCPVEVMKKVTTLMNMREVTIGYGMTETSPLSTQNAADDPMERRVSTVGRVHPHVEIKIIDPETGATLPRGSAGELCTRGYSVMLGYWNNEAATTKSIDSERWMHSGDLATLDEEGYVKIVGRIKDMIIRGGENIFPREIEEFLYGHPGVSDVQVIGVPSEKYGEEVMAWVKLREGSTASGDEMAAFCKSKIASFKIPRYWKFVDEFPLTVTGKIQKFKMREVSINELALERAAGIETA
ncbi:MAG: AMP-binding protein [Pseudomonadota bacterium]